MSAAVFDPRTSEHDSRASQDLPTLVVICVSTTWPPRLVKDLKLIAKGIELCYAQMAEYKAELQMDDDMGQAESGELLGSYGGGCFIGVLEGVYIYIYI